MKTFTLPAGTVCKFNGIPFVLVADTEVQSHEANEALIRIEGGLTSSFKGANSGHDVQGDAVAYLGPKQKASA